MNKLFFIFLLFISCNNKAQEGTSIKQIQESYINKDEKLFLDSFPENFKEFKATFGWNDKLDKPNILYNEANSYIDYFFKLTSQSKYIDYKKKILNITTDAKWEADAVGYFRDKIHLIVKNDKEFVELLNNSTDTKVNSFWLFYFDGENIEYPSELESVLGNKLKSKSKSIYEKIIKDKSSDAENIIKNKQSQFEIFDIDGYTNLREEKSSSSKIIEKVSSGEEIIILESIYDWWRIKTNEGKEGYVHKSRIRIKNTPISDNTDINYLKQNLNKLGFKFHLEKKCDLNNDKYEDKILVFKNIKEFKSDDESTKKSPIIILLADGNNKYKKFENQNIFSNNSNDFLNDIIINDIYFIVKLYNEVPNEFVVDKLITFKYNAKTKNIDLFKYEEIYTGNSPEKLMYTSKDFGIINFEEFNSSTILERVSK